MPLSPRRLVRAKIAFHDEGRQADITSGLPGVHLVGLPDAALSESRDRVRAAIINCGNRWPMSRLTLALSPATLPKMVPSMTWRKA